MSITRAEFLRLHKKQQDVGQKYATLVANTLIGEPANADKMQTYFKEWMELEKAMQKNISDPEPPSKGGRRRQTRSRRSIARRTLTRYSSSV